MFLFGSRNELCFSKLPSSRSCVSRDVTCCSSNQKQFAPTTLNNKCQKVLATAKTGAKNFSEPLYFYRPFGDSSVISSSILKRGPTPPIKLVCGLVEELKLRNAFCDTYRKNWWTTYCSFLHTYLHSHVFSQQLDQDSTVVDFVRLTYSTPKPTGRPDCLHSWTWCTRYLWVNEPPPAPC